MDISLLDDTIVALSSPYGQSMRAIIRLSGSDAIKIVKSLQKECVDGNWSSYDTKLNLANGLEIPATIFYMKTPRSYTKEDIVEIHIIGSTYIVQFIIEDIIKRGARLARPGEFTMRAFLNGRIDLVQAEAVMNLIKAEDEDELKAAVKNLSGSLSNKISYAESRLVNLLAEVEASIDFIEQDIEIISPENIKGSVCEIKALLGELLDISKEREIASGSKPRILLFGPTNAGKSTLFNKLVPRGNVITSDIPYTTRDIVSGNLRIQNTEVILLDSPGLGNSSQNDDIQAMALTRNAVRDADLIVLVVDFEHLEDLENFLKEVKGQEFIIAINKVDLLSKSKIDSIHMEFSSLSPIAISATRGDGIDALKKEIYTKVIHHRLSDAGFVINLRQRECMENAIRELDETLHLASGDIFPIELVAFCLRSAVRYLAIITGKITSDDVLQRIFSQFCVGK